MSVEFHYEAEYRRMKARHDDERRDLERRLSEEWYDMQDRQRAKRLALEKAQTAEIDALNGAHPSL